MKKYTLTVAMIAAIAVPMTSIAGNQVIDKCIDAVLKEKSNSRFIKLESLHIKGKSIYELEVADENGFEWEFMCDTQSGKIIETEREVTSPESRDFKKQAKVTLEDALKIALKSYPGKIQEVEFEIEENGEPTYEIDILGRKGVETKVEVSAITGKIIEVAIEKWEIGVEENENR